MAFFNIGGFRVFLFGQNYFFLNFNSYVNFFGPDARIEKLSTDSKVTYFFANDTI